ncbi:OmpA family protein [Oxalobacteraceae bacterium A2-2]
MRFFPLLMIAVAGLVLAGCHKKPDTPAASAPAASTAAMAPAVPAAPASAPAPAAFDPASVPLSSAKLPPFPYMDWPPAVQAGGKNQVVDAEFDRGYIAIGQQLRAVEGRINVRSFYNSDAKLTELAALRNYENAITELGGVKLPAADPSSPAFIEANGGDRYQIERTRLHLPDIRYGYTAYLIRRPDTNIWLSLGISDSRTLVTVIQEKAMNQTVGLVTADDMARELGAKGRVALYINFDVDQATLRADGQPVVAEIGKLLKQQPELKLSIEGHTDNSGNAAHNKQLSRQRAETVLARLVAGGIDPARLSAAGYGAEQPLADNASEEGRARNRRVELVKR